MAKPKSGTTKVNPDGTVTYNPITGFYGNDTLTYTLMTPDSIYSLPVFVYINVHRPTADIVITKILNTKGILYAGKQVSFSLIITNNGLDSATGVVALDTLSVNLGAATNITTSSGTGTYNPSSSSISWNAGVLQKNQQDTLTFNAIITNGTLLSNTAIVKGNQFDPDTSNNRSTILPVAIAPIPKGLPDTALTNINNPVNIAVKSNDGTLAIPDTVKVSKLPVNGTAIVNPDGTVTYTPKTGFAGKDTFTYTLTNPDSLVSNPVLVTVIVKPVGVPDIDTTIMNTPITINVKANDSAQGGNNTVAVLATPKNGTAKINLDGTITYNPTTGFYGHDTLTYTLMTPDSVYSTPVFVYINIHRPAADIVITKLLNTKGTLFVGKNVSFSLIVTNNGPDNASGVFALDTLAANLGAVTNMITNDGTASYLPTTAILNWNVGLLAKNQQDTLTFSAQIISGGLLTNTAIVKGNQFDPDTTNNNNLITPVIIKPLPTGIGDVDSTVMNNPVTTIVKANDGATSIPDTVKVATPPINGTVVINPNGSITYDPNPGFNGKDTYTYTLITPDSLVSKPVTVTVYVKPVGVNDLDSTSINTQVTTNVKGNDGNAVIKDTVKLASKPTNGTATVNSNGTVTYTPNIGFTGKDIYTYTLTTADSVVSTPITVVLLVKPVGVLDRDTTPFNTPITFNVKNNDSAKGGNNTVVINSNTHNGSIILNPNNTLTYTPTSGFVGYDTCSYLLMTADSVFSSPIYIYLTVNKPEPKKADISITKLLNTVGGIVIGQKIGFTLTVKNNGSDSATGVVAFDTLASNLGVATNILTTTGIATFNNSNGVLSWNLGGLATSQTASLTFSSQVISGSTITNTAWVSANQLDPDTTNNRSSIPLVQISIPPTGLPDVDTTFINTPITVPVKSNDGVNALNDTVKLVNSSINGIAIVNNNGTIIYTPTSGFVGKDSMTYTLTTNTGLVSPPIKVTIYVLPTGVNDIDSTEENMSVTTAILKNDGASGLVSTPILYSAPTKGKVIFNSNGTVTYTPDSSFIGTDTYQYELVTSSGLVSAPIKVTISVSLPKPKNCDLQITKELTTSGSLYVGETIGFTLTVTNNGPNDATGVIAEDLYPKNLSKPMNLTASVGSAAYVDSLKMVVWNVGGLASGQSTTLIFNAIIDSGSVLNNSAGVLGKQPDPDLSNNQASIQQTEIYPANLFIPNVITPNGDGKNDKFVIVGLGRYPNSEISIFNRWDNEVYHSSNYNNDWEGNGLNTGTYYYVLKVHLPTGSFDVKKGWVMLLK